MTTTNENTPTIIYFGNDWSADNKTSSHHIATRLLRDHRVIYVECPGLRAPQGSKRDFFKIFNKLFKVFKGVKSIDDRSYVYTLFQIPFHKYKVIQNLNNRLIVWSIKRLCNRLEVTNPILWFVVPHVAMILGHLGESLSVYYCVDDYTELPGVNKEMITKMDNLLSDKCDLIFVTSDPLYQSKIKYQDKLHLSRHGVDFDHFNSVFKKSNTIPDEIKSLSKPIIGFFGLVESWIDLDLIKFLAQRKPDWSFLIIGRVAVNIDSCKNISNIHFIGSKTYDELPFYAQSFDVALIPCKTNELIRNFNPLKLREYLAMGVPVVSVYFPEIDEFEDLVAIANTNEEFLEKIEYFLNNDTSDLINKGIEKVASESWEEKYKTVRNIVYGKIK